MNKEKKDLTIPKLRFPEFARGDEWKIEAFGSVYGFESTNSFSRDNLNYDAGEVKNIHYGDIHTKFSTLFDINKEMVPFINRSIPIDKIKPESYCMIGDMIFADASEDLKDIGKSIEIINLNNERLLSGLHTLLARQKSSKLVVGFGGHLFTTNSIRKQIQREAQGAKVLGISATRLSNIFICFPENKLEQRKIASCLSSLDDLISAHTQKMEALKAHKKGLMQQLFPAEGERVPKLRFTNFKDSGEWESHPLSDFISSLDAGVSVNSGDRPAADEELGILKTSCVTNGVFEPMENKVVAEELEIGRLKESVSRNTIIISRMNTPALVGANAYIDIDISNIFLPDRLWAAKPKLNANMRFIAHILSSVKGRKALAELATGTSDSMKNISKPDVLDMKILAPGAQEQREIADCLSSLDVLITEQIKKIQQLRDHKKGLMQGLFPNFDKVNT